MTDTRHIFLSYRSIESDFALKLATDLKNAGINLWMDRLDGIHVSEDWRQKIESALHPDACSLVIAVISPEYMKANYCRNELARADRLGIPILPLLLYPVADKPIEIERTQYIAFCRFAASGKLEQTWREPDLYASALQELIESLPAVQRGEVLDTEAQYLNSLIAELESSKGVMEYVELSGLVDTAHDTEAMRPQPKSQEAGWAAGFSMLVEVTVEREPDSGGANPLLADTPSHKIRLNSISEVVEKYPRFVLIGEPGAGKTTTMRRLALDAARKRVENPRTAPLPLVLYLPQWGDERTPIDFIKEQLRQKSSLLPYIDTLEDMLVRGEVFLYLDGLNEMGVRGDEKAAKLRQWLEGTNAPRRVIITCRAAYYENMLKLGTLPVVIVEEMDEFQIRVFAENYLGEKAPDFMENILPQNEVTENAQNLMRLAKNPYLLAALVFVYRASPHGDLPRNNGALMQKLARALWEREGQQQTPGWIPVDAMEAAFGKLAFAMIDEEQPIDVPLEFALEHLPEKSLIPVAQGANLMDVQGNHLRFHHQIIQEYFAAVELNRRGKIEDKIASPVFKFEASRPEVKSQKPQDGKWNQVIIALCGIQDDPMPTLHMTLDENPFLTADCIASGVQVTSEFRSEVITILMNLLNRDTVRMVDVRPQRNIKEWAIFIVTLPFYIFIEWIEVIWDLFTTMFTETFVTGSSGSGTSFRVYMPSSNITFNLDEELKYIPIREAAAISLGQIGDESVIKALLAALDDKNMWIRRAAASALAGLGVQGRKALLNAFNTTNDASREAVVRGLGLTGDLSFIPLLIDSVNSPHRLVRAAGLDSLKGLGASAIPALIQASREVGTARSVAAGQALRQLGDLPLKELIPLLSSETPEFQLYIARLIEHIETPQAVEILTDWWIQKLTHRENYVGKSNRSLSEFALEALTRIGTPKALEAAAQWRAEQGKKPE